MIQIDMEMPKNCLDCNLRYQSFCSVDGHHEPHLEKERCPLKVIPQEPRKEHWLHRPHVYGVTYCSICDFELKIDNTNFCPNCGADMREVKDGEFKD